MLGLKDLWALRAGFRVGTFGPRAREPTAIVLRDGAAWARTPGRSTLSSRDSGAKCLGALQRV